MWTDPDTTVSAGILLSDRIRFYVEAVSLISPFEQSRLGPASYDLTVGNEFAYHENVAATGEVTRKLSPDEQLVIQPNSIVFVITTETLTLPFYLAARFNLKLRYLHQGLLVGTGPQIDPGFSGRLSCPLHNVSSEKVSLRVGSAFAVVEFVKTTPFAQSISFGPDETLETVRTNGENDRLLGVNNWPCKTFPRKSLLRQPIRSYLPPGKSVSSSLQGLAKGLKEHTIETTKSLDTFERRMRTINVLSYLSVAVVALSLVGSFIALATWNRSIADASFRAEDKADRLEKDKQSLERRVSQLESRLVEPKRTTGVEPPVDSNGNKKPDN